MVAQKTLSLLMMAATALIPFQDYARAEVAPWTGKITNPLLVSRVATLGSGAAPMQVAGAAAGTAPLLPANYFGLHILHLQYGAVWPTMKFGTWRLWDAGVNWRDIQSSPTTYNWQTLDTYMALAQQKGVDVILELGVTPQWASSRPSEAAGYGPGAAAPPASTTSWTNYVKAVATRYKGKIAYYEVWNEANTHQLWTGTPTELVQLTSLASKTIKSVDPAAQIISPSISNTNSTSVAYLKSLLDVGLGATVDVIGLHLYQIGKTPEAILPGVQAVQALLKQYNLSGKPMICTEFGWATPTTFNNVDDQSGYLMRSILVGWGAGVSRFMWYAWDNTNYVTVVMTSQNYKSPTMVAQAYATLEQWTVGKEVSRCAVNTGTIWSCDITDTSGDHSRIYWNTAGSSTIKPTLTWKPTRLIDMYGNTTVYAGGMMTVNAHPVLVKE